MKHLLYVLLFIILVFFMGSCGDIEEKYSVSGIVKNELSRPVANCWVYGYSKATNQYINKTITDKDGSYILPGFKKGTYLVGLDVFNTDRCPAFTYIDIAENSVSDLNFQLSCCSYVTGNVKEKNTLNSMSGVLIEAYLEDSPFEPVMTVLTDSEGYYNIQLPLGTYILRAVSKDINYIPQFYNEANDFYRATSVQIKKIQKLNDINFMLIRGGSISGIISEKLTNTPMENAFIKAFHLEPFEYVAGQISQPDGTYTLYLPEGNYKFCTSYKDITFTSQWYEETYNYFAAKTFTIQSGDSITNINFNIEPGGKISGRIISEVDNSQISGLWVEAYNKATDTYISGTTTDSDGNYTLSLPVGEYFLLAGYYEDNYAGIYFEDTFDYFSAMSIEVKKGQTTTDINFKLKIGGKITGKVVASSGEPVKDIWISAFIVSSHKYIGSVFTKADGTYDLNLPEGNYKIHISEYNTDYAAQWYEQTYDYFSSKTVEIKSGKITENINFSIESGGSIIGKIVRDITNEAIPNLWIEAYDVSTDKYIGGTVTDSDGNYILSLPVGKYILLAGYYEDYEGIYYNNAKDYYAAIPLEINAGQRIENINFKLKPKL
ncbi:MAG: carboxypeptidase regulatory-like domain-containing protein [Desulfobacterales bacterium]|nr:carboxypeptidase regulatory-like domain-containing protein [Desulfobacterales bacterium]